MNYETESYRKRADYFWEAAAGIEDPAARETLELIARNYEKIVEKLSGLGEPLAH